MTSYTKDQETLVEKLLTSKSDYYKLLSVTKSSTSIEIKKSYRKLALKVHPDKNPHPKAPEAFKAVNKAFEVLSDENKKRLYDLTGEDPDSRVGGGGAGGAGGNGNSPFARAYPMGQNADFPFDADIFNLFFGANGAGGGMPQGFHTFTFGGPNVNFQTFQQGRTRRPRRTAANNENANDDLVGTLTQLLPIILLVLFSLITSYLGNDNSTSVQDFSFDKTKSFNIEKNSMNYKVRYFLNKDQFETYKIKDLNKIDRKVENEYIKHLNYKCSYEQNEKEQILKDATGFFYNDEELMKRGENFPTPACDQLRMHGLL